MHRLTTHLTGPEAGPASPAGSGVGRRQTVISACAGSLLAIFSQATTHLLHICFLFLFRLLAVPAHTHSGRGGLGGRSATRQRSGGWRRGLRDALEQLLAREFDLEHRIHDLPLASTTVISLRPGTSNEIDGNTSNGGSIRH